MVELPDGAKIDLPISLFHNLELTSDDSGLVILKGRKKNADVLFLCILKKNPPAGFEPLSILLDSTGQHSIRTKDMSESSVDNSSPSLKLMRIISPGPYFDYLIAVNSFTYQKTRASFILLGSDSDFYQTIPDFRRMVTQFRLPDIKPGDRPVPPWLVMAAIVLLAINTCIIWYGIHRIAIHKRER